MASLEDTLFARQIESIAGGSVASTDVLPIGDVSEFGPTRVKRVTVADLATAVGASITDLDGTEIANADITASSISASAIESTPIGATTPAAIAGTTLSLSGLGNYADDAAAAAGLVPVGGIYHTAGALKVRLT